MLCIACLNLLFTRIHGFEEQAGDLLPPAHELDQSHVIVYALSWQLLAESTPDSGPICHGLVTSRILASWII